MAQLLKPGGESPPAVKNALDSPDTDTATGTVRWTSTDPIRAVRAIGVLFVVGGVSLLASLVWDTKIGVPSSRVEASTSPGIVPLIVVGLVVCGIGWAMWRVPHRTPAWTTLAVPVVGLLTIVVLNLVTEDATAGPQLAMLAPVVYAAAYLERRGLLLVTGVGVGGIILVAVALEPGPAAFHDALSGAVITVMSGLTVAIARRGRERGLAELRRRADLDALTGVSLRHVLDTAIARLITDPVRAPGAALIIVDVDHFKAVNDEAGHVVGDAALCHIADVIQRNVRPTDIVSRVGGDEFAVLLPECAHASAAARARAVVAEIQSTPLTVGARTLQLSVSAGVAHFPDTAQTVRDLYRVADRALYEAKAQGRNRLGVPSVLVEEAR